MPTREVPSLKDCKDCGKPAYSYQIGWVDEDGNINWHPTKNYNQCKECRKEMYKGISKTKKSKRDALIGDSE